MTNGFFLWKTSIYYICNISAIYRWNFAFFCFSPTGLTFVIKYIFQFFLVVIQNVRNMDNFLTVQIADVLLVYDNSLYTVCYVMYICDILG